MGRTQPGTRNASAGTASSASWLACRDGRTFGPRLNRGDGGGSRQPFRIRDDHDRSRLDVSEYGVAKTESALRAAKVAVGQHLPAWLVHPEANP